MEGKRPDSAEERRRSQRLSCAALACSCSVSDESPDARHGAVLSDISAEGASFETDFEPAPGRKMCLEVRPIEGPAFEVVLIIVHVQPSRRDGFFHIGSRFEDPDRHRDGLFLLLKTIRRMERDLEQA